MLTVLLFPELNESAALPGPALACRPDRAGSRGWRVARGEQAGSPRVCEEPAGVTSQHNGGPGFAAGEGSDGESDYWTRSFIDMISSLSFKTRQLKLLELFNGCWLVRCCCCDFS